MLMHSAEKPHADCRKQRRGFCLMLVRTAGRCGRTGTVFFSVLQRGAASRTSQGLAELAHENKKMEP